MHLDNLEKILTFILRETSAQKMIDILYDRIEFFVERHILLRDVENFAAYFKFLLSTSLVPKKLKFEPKLVQAFVDRTYAGFSASIQKFRARKLYAYLKNKLELGTKVSDDNLALLENILKIEKKPTFDRLVEHIRIAVILKWLQGPLKDQVSEGLKDYVIFLATVYGQYEKNRVLNVEWHPYAISEEDMTLIVREYKIFETSIMEALQVIREAISKNPDPKKYQEQFRIVIVSLDNLVKLSKKGELNSFEAFRDKIIVAITLIYVQDDFVEKDSELKKLIQLFISLYRQFSDKSYATVKVEK